MGCASSKQARLERKSKALATRSYSLPHQPARVSDGSHVVVALTSTTLGSLELESLDQYLEQNGELKMAKFEGKNVGEGGEFADFANGVSQAKTWSSMIEEKIPRLPRTPTLTPPNEPEIINAWELMEGLEDCSPLLYKSFSFHTCVEPCSENDTDFDGRSCLKLENGSLPPKTENDQQNTKWEGTSPSVSPKPGWYQADSSIDFDPEIISTFRKALEEISPSNGFPERPPVILPFLEAKSSEKASLAQSRLDDFQKKIDTEKFAVEQACKCPPGGENKVVFYITSLRGIRKTYEDCCRVSLILKGFGVRVDERDVSMHYEFREELKELLGEEGRSLPKLFAKGRYLGGADDVRQLHEAGELEKIFQGCELIEDGAPACESCGDVRFINCESCFGSCKIFYEEDEEDYDEDVAAGGFQRCPDCNENGIIRCPVCCS